MPFLYVFLYCSTHRLLKVPVFEEIKKRKLSKFIKSSTIGAKVGNFDCGDLFDYFLDRRSFRPLVLFLNSRKIEFYEAQ